MKQLTVNLLLIILMAGMSSCHQNELTVNPEISDLTFNDLATTWDEGMPLGNATVGALVWQKDSSLRISLDRVDLWDLRPTENIWGENFKFEWVYNQVMKNDYKPVQEMFDIPYDRDPAPSKIPGAGMEFNLAGMGEVENIRLYLKNALCQVKWKNGASMKTFVHATRPVGWFVVENANESFLPVLVPPVYSSGELTKGGDPVSGLSLTRLGYQQGEVKQEANKIVYHQKGWGDFYYDVAIKWEKKGADLIGVWSVTSSLVEDKASELVDNMLGEGIEKHYGEHMEWWNAYWAKSSVSLPDSVLQKQYDNEMYKFGSATREDSYPISLQSVWTADNGKMPPWKGDYHHDLNTQLSAWPTYAGNRLEEGYGYLHTLWDQREVNKKYTKTFYGTNGLNVPGVATLTGQPMGGWIQYSFSPTVSAWLAQHFYLHWKYSADQEFLKERGYPYVKDVAVHLEELSEVKDGKRVLPLCSSPEIFNNSLQAWFHTYTNYDLAMVNFAFMAAAEMADALGLKQEADHWQSLRSELPSYELDPEGGLAFAKGFNYESSHRHFSHLMAFHPFGMIDWSNGEEDQKIIQATIDQLLEVGPGAWCGYSYSWLGNLQARAFNGEGAASALRDFANCFCLRNTFHANGDQTKSGKSGFTYRPFTLEGNFAFASGIHEMLIQSHTDVVRVFPAIPANWDHVSFDKLRAVGAFLVSAERKNGETVSVEIVSEKGGEMRLQNPFSSENVKAGTNLVTVENGLITLSLKAGEKISLTE
ncbi:glycosyl hydrolase family 95 catalytic domain-containing protein [Sunxiuqinia rutila]|uniref:glycosyl hydrolase family 95 catalytic domain-containing protein n=1 Tax=Sunxiuqinia rutila TaxID=1397841 RepID=UPI003D36DA60